MNPPVKFTKTRIDELQPASKRYEILDRTVPGLTCRVYPTGHKMFTVLHRVDGKQVRVKIGNPLHFTVEQAQAQARDILTAKVKPSGATFGQVAEAYQAAHVKWRPRTRSQVEGYLMRLSPSWDQQPIESITPDLITALLQTYAAKSPVAANRLRTLLGSVWKWAIKKQLAAVNPVLPTDQPAAETPRERELSDEELRTVWRSLDSSPAHVAAYFRAMVLTGCRRNEVRDIQLTEIAGDLWTIPGSRTKNHMPYVVPLSPYLDNLLLQVTHFDPAHHWADIRPGDATIRDLRRTFASNLGRLGVQPHVISACLNHKPSGVTARVYNRHTYLPEKREALATLEDWVKQIVGENLLQFPQVKTA